MIEKYNNWQIAFGLNEVDEIEPSHYLQCLAEANIIGLITDKQAEEMLLEHYKETGYEIHYGDDLVALRIKRILALDDFSLSKEYLYAIHSYLFTGVYPDAGVTRHTNLTKKENCLNEGTVIYSPMQSIEDNLEYDFSEEKKKQYKGKSINQIIPQLINFISNIWQAHAFGDGNTRTVSIFLEKYLRSFGYDVNNSVFKENSVYFRNSLVRSNYTSVKDLIPTQEYLQLFFKKLLIDPNIELNIEDTYIESITRS